VETLFPPGTPRGAQYRGAWRSTSSPLPGPGSGVVPVLPPLWRPWLVAAPLRVRVVPVPRSSCLQSAVCSYRGSVTAPNVWEPGTRRHAPGGTPQGIPEGTPEGTPGEHPHGMIERKTGERASVPPSPSGKLLPVLAQESSPLAPG